MAPYGSAPSSRAGRRLRTAPIGWEFFSGNTTCSGTPTSSGSIAAITGGNGTDIPVAPTSLQSLRLTAGVVTGYSFSSWSGNNAVFNPTNASPSCLKGDNNTLNTQANYTAATNAKPGRQP